MRYIQYSSVLANLYYTASEEKWNGVSEKEKVVKTAGEIGDPGIQHEQCFLNRLLFHGRRLDEQEKSDGEGDDQDAYALIDASGKLADDADQRGAEERSTLAADIHDAEIFGSLTVE